MPGKILIVDDEDEIRELVHVTLEDEGFEIREASDGNEALIKAKEFKPDLVILDIMIPGKTGYEVCEELKKDPDTKNVFVLFLSARGKAASVMTGKLKGGDEFMTKPFEPKELREKILKVLGGK